MLLAPSLRCRTLLACSRRQSVRCFAAAAPPSLNFNKAVDKAHEGKALSEIVQLPPGALQGLREGAADEVLAQLNLKTIRDLAEWRYWRAARGILVLAATEEAGKRPDGAASNINGIVDKAYESASLNELLAAPPSALQGLAGWTDEALAQLGIKSIKDLASWKYAAWAEALTTLAEHERADGASR